MKDKFPCLNRTGVFQEYQPYSQLSLTHSWKWWGTCRSLYVGGRAVSECRRDCYWSPWVWRSSRWYGIHYLIFHKEYRIRICSYPILGSCDPGKAWTGSRGSRSRLGFWSHRLRILQFYSPRLGRSRHLEGRRADNFRYGASAPSRGRKSLSKTRRGTGSRCCDSIWGKDYNTMSLTCIFPAESGGLFWISWLIDGPAEKHGPSQSARSNYLIFFLHVSSLLSFCNLPPLFSSKFSRFACMEPISHSACWCSHSGCSTRKKPHLFFGWHHNL